MTTTDDLRHALVNVADVLERLAGAVERLTDKLAEMDEAEDDEEDEK